MHDVVAMFHVRLNDVLDVGATTDLDVPSNVLKDVLVSDEFVASGQDLAVDQLDGHVDALKYDELKDYVPVDDTLDAFLDDAAVCVRCHSHLQLCHGHSLQIHRTEHAHSRIDLVSGNEVLYEVLVLRTLPVQTHGHIIIHNRNCLARHSSPDLIRTLTAEQVLRNSVRLVLHLRHQVEERS